MTRLGDRCSKLLSIYVWLSMRYAAKKNLENNQRHPFKPSTAAKMVLVWLRGVEWRCCHAFQNFLGDTFPQSYTTLCWLITQNPNKTLIAFSVCRPTVKKQQQQKNVPRNMNSLVYFLSGTVKKMGDYYPVVHKLISNKKVLLKFNNLTSYARHNWWDN